MQQHTRVFAQGFGQEVENISHLKLKICLTWNSKEYLDQKNKSEKYIYLPQKALTSELIVVLFLKIES